MVGTRGNFFGNRGVATSAAGLCFTRPSRPSQRYSERSAASARATEVLLNPVSYKCARKPRIQM